MKWLVDKHHRSSLQLASKHLKDSIG